MPIEAVVAKINDLQDGEMKEVLVGETKVLLTRIKGKFHAIGGICTHYGGHLAEGALCGERVYCPWHQSAFNVISGDLEEVPGLDAVPRFEVRVEGENVIVQVAEGASDRRTMPMAKLDPQKDKRTFVILGAGGAAIAAAETLRQDGFQGQIVMISKDSSLPYDRPEVSKGYLKGDSPKEGMLWRSSDFYQEHDIRVLLSREVTEVDANARTAKFRDGSSLKYDTLLLATGGIARHLRVRGERLANIFTLRSMDDADRIVAAAANSVHTVCVGGSFIAMEVAQSLVKRGVNVTVVAASSLPFKYTLGPEIGQMWQQIHEEHGVSFRMGARVARFDGEIFVRTVVLDDGTQLEADMVVVGIGSEPATNFLKGVHLNVGGTITVDQYMRVMEGLFAAGDIARFPDWRTGELIRIEHWRLAMQLGRIAAHNMAGKKVAYTGVPFFWTDQFDNMMQYVGYVSGWDEIIYQGSPADRNFMAFYVKHNQVLAAAGMQHEKEMAALAELMRLKQAPTPAECRKGVDLLARLSGAR
ncbi:MAG: FAD-dependent oxidoreductase, partial [Syntrophales bacterium]